MTTSANVDLCVPNNAYWQDAFQFGVDGDTSWDFDDKSFIMEIKVNRDAVAALLTLTSPVRIVVDSEPLRILHFFVTDDDIRAALPNGTYAYDLIMVDDTNDARTRLMYGNVTITQGVTLSD